MSIKIGTRKTNKQERDDFGLPATKCIDLANYLFGFNNWRTEITECMRFEPVRDKDRYNAFLSESEETWMRTRKDRLEFHPSRPSFICSIRLLIGNVFVVHATGVGHSQTFESKESMFENAKKRAVSNAHRNAFTNLLVIRLVNGKMDIREIT